MPSNLLNFSSLLKNTYYIIFEKMWSENVIMRNIKKKIDSTFIHSIVLMVRDLLWIGASYNEMFVISVPIQESIFFFFLLISRPHIYKLYTYIYRCMYMAVWLEYLRYFFNDWYVIEAIMIWLQDSTFSAIFIYFCSIVIVFFWRYWRKQYLI